VKGYSLFFAPSAEMHTDYPHLKHLWTMGPSTAPHDTMHLVLLNVFCRTCGISSLGLRR